MEKWEGKVCTTLPCTKPHQIWPLFKDFFNIHKWFPSLTNTYGVRGNNGEAGCIRFCLGFFNGGDVAMWARERVTAVDEVNMRLSYDLVESNLGFMNYESTVMISPMEDQDRDQGCVIEWVFRVDPDHPVQGLRFEDLVYKYGNILHHMLHVLLKTDIAKL